ncbi:DExH-box ATP-dependent RNA helicase DExH17 isoform X2 [Primulina huaijiensis]|uniref:DExH-box ATP-dependent RNA helicase DExH17 isoform X2 n=1 Tax=Primulina huaijiensis TaxID=1492673 RepID=UPI003CC75112
MDSYTLKAVNDLPVFFRSAFNFRYFNSLQSECFSTCFQSDVNMVISAPTGSGKTVLFELCIMRLLSKFIGTDGNFVHLKGTLKTIYIAPSKALVQEKLRDWTQKLGPLGIKCLEMTGDSEFYRISNIQEADIILTTPEKFDAATRYRIKDGGLSFFSDIALVLIDEVHLLNDPRGAALEAIVSRIKMLACNPEMRSSSLSHVRFLAVSATIPNINDLAEWLVTPSQGIKRFGEEMRPVKLTTKVLGYTRAKNDFLFEKSLQNYIFDLLKQYSGGKSALIFCSTRKGAQEAAQRLSQIAMTFGNSSPFIKGREEQERLREASLSCGDKQMQSYMLYGVGYHNGGLALKDRNLIEGLFLNGDLQILCTTNTLAHGINLPAHTVIIKSTQYFNKEKGTYMEYDRSMVLQMCGRAGRPPFDDTGMVIIMTRKETVICSLSFPFRKKELKNRVIDLLNIVSQVHLYENLLNGCEMVESQLLPCVTEHLTAEIVQATVSDITMAIEWMKCSYLYVRMKKNPENYSILKGLSGDQIEKHLQEICVQKVNELSQYQMVWTDEDGFLLKPLEPGRLMTKYYLKFDTMKHIIQAPANCSMEDVLHIICRAEEIAWIQLRRNEKKFLNDINNEKDCRLRFHVLDDKGKRKKRIQTREEKIFILVNDCLTGDPLVHDLSMSQDMNSVCSNGCRIAKCMKEYFLYKKSYRGALNSTLLAKCLHQKLWDDSQYLLKQLPGIGMVTAKALLSMGIKSFEALSEADPRKIELITGRKYPYGNHIKESLQSLPPKVEMIFKETDGQKQGKSKLLITLTRLSHPHNSTKRHYADMMVGLEEDNLILFHEKIRLEDFSSPYNAVALYKKPRQGKLIVKAALIVEEFSIDLHQKVIITPEIDLNVHNYRPKKPSSIIHNDLTILKDDNDCTSHAQEIEQSNSNELTKKSNSMPSFKLLDEELEDNVVIENGDADCKIINERTVFDHIRKKAKKLPPLPVPNDACSPSLETFAFIRKRTREQHMELDNDVEFVDMRDDKFPTGTVLIQSPELSEPKQNRPIFNSSNGFDLIDKGKALTELWSEGGKVATKYLDIEPRSLNQETVFDHIRKKSRNFPALASTRITRAEIIDLDCDTNQNTVHNKGTFSIAPTNLGEDVQELKQALRCKTSNSSTKAGFSLINSPNGLDLKTSQVPSVLMEKNNGESTVKQLQPLTSVEIRNCSPALTGEVGKESFLGFESVFSFLF